MRLVWRACKTEICSVRRVPVLDVPKEDCKALEPRKNKISDGNDENQVVRRVLNALKGEEVRYKNMYIEPWVMRRGELSYWYG